MRNELYLKSHLSFFITKIEKEHTGCVGVYNSDAFFLFAQKTRRWSNGNDTATKKSLQATEIRGQKAHREIVSRGKDSG